MIVEVDPISNCSCCVLKAFEAMPVDALLLQSPNDAFDHAVLLRTVRRNELLFKTIAADQLSECEAGKNEAIIGTEEERALDLSQRSVAGNESLLKSCSSR